MLARERRRRVLRVVASAGGDVTVTGAPAQSSDDARQSSGTPILTELALTVSGTNPVGIRFVLSGTIPQGSTILSAVMTVLSNENDTNAFTMRYSGEATGTPATYTTDANNISGRSYTTATVDEVNPAFVLNERFVCTDISTIVQEIVDADDLEDLAIQFIEVSGGTRSFYSYDTGAASAATITITYTPPA